MNLGPFNVGADGVRPLAKARTPALFVCEVQISHPAGNPLCNVKGQIAS
jgi:hypothetical protein